MRVTGALLSVGLAVALAVPANAGVLTTHGLFELHPTVISLRAGATATAPTTADCEAEFQFACYGADQLERAYGLPKLFAQGVQGQGQTIAIVDSFGSPTIQHDLAVFDQTYGLPPADLTVIQPAGPVPPFTGSGAPLGWALEASLDVEWAHVVAPKAKLLLVETPTAETEGTVGFPDIVTAEKYVIDHQLATVISQSFNATEETFPDHQSLLDLRSAYVDAAAHHVTVLAASGDAGAADFAADGQLFPTPATGWPATDPLVTAIGGTQLSLDVNGDRTRPDVVWNDSTNVAVNQVSFGNNGPNPLASGGGASSVFGRPTYQPTTIGESRGVPDISMSSACDGGVNVYTSFAGVPVGWSQQCGTSEGTPEFAGIVALAAQVAGHRLGLINPALYALAAYHAPGIVDVTQGNNTVGSTSTQDGTVTTVPGFDAGSGYDLASGVGTVNAPLFVGELAQALK